MYKVNEETNQIEMDEEYVLQSAEEFEQRDNWCHYFENILNSGRVRPYIDEALNED